MRRAGFTLLEATVALLIIGLVAVGALEAVATEMDAARRTRMAAPALAVAAERLARLELLDARTLQTLPDSSRAGRVVDGLLVFEWNASAEPVADEQDLYAIRVNVRWPEGAYSLASRVYRPAEDASP